MILSPQLKVRASSWTEMKRWEKRELGQELRRLGLSYREISEIIPVSKGTLSGWCRDIELPDELQERLRMIRPSLAVRMELGRHRRMDATKRRLAIRKAAAHESALRRQDPAWVAGVVAYWAEGAKRCNELVFSNSDPDLMRLFVLWATTYLDLDIDRFTAKLHLHSGQDESERLTYWSAVTRVPLRNFGKTFVKPEGTGHRKNVLYNGTLSVRVTRSADLLQRVLGWIDGLRD